MKKALILAGLAAVVAATLLFFKPWSDDQSVNSFRTQRALINRLRIAVGATGTLNPVMVVNVGTQVSGTIKEIHVDYNDSVKAGQLLVVLDDQLFKAKADMSRANLANAEAQLRLAALKHERQERLFKAGSAPKEDLDTALANLDMAKASVAQHRASMAQDEYNLNNTRIVSPVDGVVVNRDVDVGQTVAASFQTPTLIDIAGDLTKMQINASFAEADVGRLAPGLEGSFTVDAFPGETFAAKLRQIRLNPTITSNVVTYDVVLDVQNPTLKLLPGMTAYVDIELYREDDVLLAPNAALSWRPRQTNDGAADAAVVPAPAQTSSQAQGPAGENRTQDQRHADGQASQDQAGQRGQGPRSQEPELTTSGASDQAPAPGQNLETSSEPKVGVVYVLDKAGRPQPVTLSLGATDQRYTVVKSGDLKADDLVIIGENAQAAPAAGFMTGGGGPRRL
ncbi:MAG: efflux RND transporter periplasmic adaptor subunit [Deltaproteobacteria bacterium]|jgi:HlyD family secretion protein|nr:efflux RND transporter periplasmic adaptor subunit [Deltaproteobacteria bacterium]